MSNQTQIEIEDLQKTIKEYKQQIECFERAISHLQQEICELRAEYKVGDWVIYNNYMGTTEYYEITGFCANSAELMEIRYTGAKLTKNGKSKRVQKLYPSRIIERHIPY